VTSVCLPNLEYPAPSTTIHLYSYYYIACNCRQAQRLSQQIRAISCYNHRTRLVQNWLTPRFLSASQYHLWKWRPFAEADSLCGLPLLIEPDPVSILRPIALVAPSSAKFAALAPTLSNSLLPQSRLILAHRLSLIAPLNFIGIGRELSSSSRTSESAAVGCSPWPALSGSSLFLLILDLCSPWYREAHRLDRFLFGGQDTPEHHRRRRSTPLSSPSPTNTQTRKSL